MATTPSPKNSSAKGSTRPKAEGPTKTVKPEAELEASPLSIEGIRSNAINHIAVKAFMFLLLGIFAVGFLFTSFNPNQGTNPDGTPIGGGPSTVAMVGNDSIERERFQQIAARQDEFMAQFGQKVGPLEYFPSRQRTLQMLIDNTAQVQAARDAGITVSRDEINAEMNKRIDEQIKSEQSQGEAAFRRAVEARYGSVQNYRTELQKLMESDRENLERSLLVTKLENQVKEENKITEADYRRSQTKLKLRQIVIRPALAPASDQALTDKNKAQAKTKADRIVAELKKTPTPQAFYALAKKESDDAATKAQGGDLGWKLPAEIPVSPQVRNAVVNSTSKVVGPIVDENTGDTFVFMVEERALRLPADFEKNKKKLLEEFETAQDNEAWANRQAEISKAAQYEISDPGMQAFKIQSEQIFSAPADQQDKLREEALAKYQEALGYAGGIEGAAVRYQMAQLYRELKQPQKAVEVLKVAAEQTTDAPQLDVEYARALRDAGNQKEALAQLQKVSKELDEAPPAQPSMFGGNPTDAVRMQISSEFEALGNKELAEKERQKVQQQGMGGMPGGMMMPGGEGAITIPPR